MEGRTKWYELNEVSKQLGFNKDYASKWLSRHREELPKEMLIESESGKTRLISEEGIKWIRANTKKEGALVSSNSADEDKYLICAVLGKAPNVHFTGWDRGSLEKNTVIM